MNSGIFSDSLGITLKPGITTVELSGTSLVITQFAPIHTLLPTCTPPIIFAPQPMKTLLPLLTVDQEEPPLIVIESLAL